MNLTNYYMESLAKIHAPSSDTKNLWKFGDLCEANIRGLETLGVMTESYGSLLIPILLKKKSKSFAIIRKSWRRYHHWKRLLRCTDYCKNNENCKRRLDCYGKQIRVAPIRTRSKREQPCNQQRLKHTLSKDRNRASRRVKTRQPINQVLGNQQDTRRKRPKWWYHHKISKNHPINKATGRYNVRLPWKLNKHDIPPNFILSKRRLNSQLNSLNKKDPGLIKKYNDQLLEQVNLGFIEKVRNLNLDEGILHYIPHFPVFKTDCATTKMQIAGNASASVIRSIESKWLSIYRSKSNAGSNWYPIEIQDQHNSLHSRYKKSFPTNWTKQPRQGRH